MNPDTLFGYLNDDDDLFEINHTVDGPCEKVRDYDVDHDAYYDY